MPFMWVSLIFILLFSVNNGTKKICNINKDEKKNIQIKIQFSFFFFLFLKRESEREREKKVIPKYF